ncbi:MAG TPA: nicotinate phosphoribosyltransferase, partial [Acidimicrobiales bacterium]
MTDGRSTALLTDHYELTMLDAALRSNTAAMPVTFEVFARRLPPGRRVGVFAGLGRLLDALEEFHFGPDQLRWLADVGVVSAATIDWLRDFRFHGSIDAYAEGEWYTQGSPVLTVEGTFAETVLLETLVLSILNHDSAIAAAASLLAGAAGERPLIEMGSRRTDPDAAVAAARAAYLSGFASTSNLEAGRRYTIPTAGTAAHAFVLVHRAEREAFAAQVAALGADTTLLVDTFDTEAGIRTAVEVAGPTLGAVRIDSGDPATTVPRARHLLDSLGASATKIIVTGDLDERVIGVLSTVPADGYGVGTNLVTGLGAPTAGFVYKLVAVANDAGGQHPVAKLSPGKATVGGRKWAWRARQTLAPGDYESPVAPLDVSVGSADEGTGDDDRGRVGARHRGAPTARGARAVLGDVVALSADGAEPTWR